MATTQSDSAPRDSGTKFKLVVRLCGLIAIGGIFLPFIDGASIIDMVRGGGYAMEAQGFGGMIAMFAGGATVTASLTKILMLLGFILIPILGLSMLIRGKYAGHQITFLLLYNLAAFLMVMFFGEEAHMNGGFFSNVGIGYWVSTAGLFIPIVGMFFLDESI